MLPIRSCLSRRAFASTLIATAFAGPLTLNACSGPQVLNALSPSTGITTARDIAYGTGPRRTLDIYTPTGARDAPTVVFFYGGSWQEGAKADYAFVARALASRGIVVAVPDYRLYPEVKFAGFMADAAAATAWVHRNAAAYGGDPNRLVVMGHSAGAHIAALLALDPHWLSRAGLDRSRALAGFVGLAGPYDFLPIQDPKLKIVFGPPARIADTQPITFADGRNPPAFLGTDADDTTVQPRNTAALAERIRQGGGPVQVKTYPGLTHRTLIGVVSEPLGGTAPVRDDVVDFIRAVAGVPRS